MKKFIVLCLFGLLVMASNSVYAQTLEFKASGYLEMQTYWYRNVATGLAGQNIATFWTTPFYPDTYPTVNSGAWDRTNAYLEYRARLRFDAIMGKALSGTFVFELDSTRWGDFASDNFARMGRGNMGYWTADRASIEIKNVFFDVAIPEIGIPVPLTARVGLQPLVIRPNMFVASDGMGITGGIKIDPVTIAPLWFKALEGKDASADDVDIYGLHVIAKVAKFTIGGYTLFYNMNTYPLNLVTSVYGANPTNQAAMWWFGAYADGRLGPVNLNFDFVYDYGEVEKKHGAWAPDVDYRGWATRLKIEYPWEKFNFGGTFLYATGADLQDTNRTGYPDSTLTGSLWGTPVKKVTSYVTPPGSEEWSAFGESLCLYGSWITASATPTGSFPALAQYPIAMTRGTIGGTWMAKLFAGFKATPWYKVTLEAMYIGDTTKHGNTLGDAQSWAGTPRNDKSIGWEFDLINEINIYKNLKWSIGLGYLFAGDALDQFAGIVGVNDSPKNPWMVGTKLQYTF